MDRKITRTEETLPSKEYSVGNHKYTGSKRGSGSRSNHNRARNESRRTALNETISSQLAKDIRERLLPGVKDSETAQSRLDQLNTNKAVPIPITTRQCGFSAVITTQAIFQNAPTRVPAPGDVYNVYRTYLALHQTKMLVARRKQAVPDHTNLTVPPIPSDAQQVLRTLTYLPDPITRPLNAIGVLKDAEVTYIPVYPDDSYDDAQRFIPRPENIHFTNLRRTVTALSDVNTPAAVRLRFYRNNPIPGAKWNVQNVNAPLLSNPDEIIPANYDPVIDLNNDIRLIKAKLEFLAKELPKYYSKTVNFPGEGSKAMLSSNAQNGMRVIDRGDEEDILDYMKRIKIDGNITDYYNVRPLANADQLSANFSLLGEHPLTVAQFYPTFANRDIGSSCQISTTSYLACTSMIYA